MLIPKARRTGFADGRISTVSLSFDGSEGLLNETEQSIGITNSWTILIVYKASTNGPSQNRLFALRNDSAFSDIRVSRDVSGDDDLRTVIWPSNGGSDMDHTNTEFGIPSDTWHRYIMEWDGSTLRHYWNGFLRAADGTLNNPITQADNNRNVAIGYDGTVGVGQIDPWTGTIHHVIVWDTTLTDAQKAAACQKGYNPHQSDTVANLKHWWRCGMPVLGSMKGSTYVCDSIATGGIDVSVDAVSMSDSNIVNDAPGAILYNIPTNATNQTNTAGYSFSVTVPDRNNRLLVVGIASRDSTSAADTVVSGVTYGGVAMTQIRSEDNGGGGSADVRADLWVLADPAVGTANVAITLAGTVNQSIATAVTFFNVNATHQDATAQGTNANGTNPSLSITTVTDQALCVGWLVENNTPTLTAASNQFEWVREIGDGSNYVASMFIKDTTTAGAKTNNITATSNKYGYILMALRPTS